jgi:hypothetical protein
MKPHRSLLAPLLTFLSRLRYRSLFLIAAGLLAVDMVVPDVIPFVDEIILGVATIVLARLRKPENVNEQSKIE